MIYLFIFRQRWRGRERERNINVWLPLTHPAPPPPLGTCPATQACALTKNWTSEPFGWQAHAQSTDLHKPGLFIFIFIFEFRGRGRAGEREGEKHWCEKYWLVASHMYPKSGLNLQPRHVPWLGIEPVTFQFLGQCPTKLHWSGQTYFLLSHKTSLIG